MKRRQQGGWVWFFLDSRSEKIAAILTGITAIIIAFNAPPPRVTVANGIQVREAVFFGHVFPKWQFILALLLPVLLVFWIYLKLVQWIWPDRPRENVAVEKVYQRPGGGYYAWKPEEPGTPSPMDYEPPNFSAETTAEEFLSVTGPNSMRTLLGVDVMEEGFEFERLRKEWIKVAPESTLRDLFVLAEERLRVTGDDYHVLGPIMDSHELRGTPTRLELVELGKRLGSENLYDWLDEEQSKP